MQGVFGLDYDIIEKYNCDDDLYNYNTGETKKKSLVMKFIAENIINW